MADQKNQKSERRSGEMQEPATGSGANQSNPEGIDDAHQRDFRDPHGNQSLRQPSGGSGAGETRGDASSYNPAPATGLGTHKGTDADPVEGSRDDYGADGETQE